MNVWVLTRENQSGGVLCEVVGVYLTRNRAEHEKKSRLATGKTTTANTEQYRIVEKPVE